MTAAVRATLPVKPPLGVTVMVAVPLWPGLEMVMLLLPPLVRTIVAATGVMVYATEATELFEYPLAVAIASKVSDEETTIGVL